MCHIIFIDDDIRDVKDYILACEDIQGKKVKYFVNTDTYTKQYISENHQMIDLIVLDIKFTGNGEDYYGGYDEGVKFYKSFLKTLDNLLVIIFTNKIPENYLEDFSKHDIDQAEIEVIEKNKISIRAFKEKVIKLLP